MFTKNKIVLLLIYTVKNTAPIKYKDGKENQKLNLKLIKSFNSI